MEGVLMEWVPMRLVPRERIGPALIIDLGVILRTFAEWRGHAAQEWVQDFQKGEA